ncbi:hypothetical protein ABPG75_013524 [Micractinium tetrahymenae]
MVAALCHPTVPSARMAVCKPYGAAKAPPTARPTPCRRSRRLAVAAAAQGSSGAASFGQDEGRVGGVAFSGGAKTAGAAPQAAGAAADDSSSSSSSSKRSFWDLRSLQQQIQSLGLAGVTAYGLFNTLYYTCAFLFAWIYVAKVPPGQGMAATAKAFAGMMGLVWAGSQVTKAPRAAAALMLAPLVDRGMAWLQRSLGLRTRRAVFLVFVAACLGLAVALFGAVVVLWS